LPIPCTYSIHDEDFENPKSAKPHYEYWVRKYALLYALAGFWWFLEKEVFWWATLSGWSLLSLQALASEKEKIPINKIWEWCILLASIGFAATFFFLQEVPHYKIILHHVYFAGVLAHGVFLFYGQQQQQDPPEWIIRMAQKTMGVNMVTHGCLGILTWATNMDPIRISGIVWAIAFVGIARMYPEMKKVCQECAEADMVPLRVWLGYSALTALVLLFL